MPPVAVRKDGRNSAFLAKTALAIEKEDVLPPS